MTKVYDRFYGKKLQSGDDNLRYFNEYHTSDVLVWHYEMLHLVKEAEAAGYTDVEVGFKSTLEPYEDCTLGPVIMFVEGYRDKTPKELEADVYQKKLEDFAREKGCTLYDAKQFFELQSKGVI